MASPVKTYKINEAEIPSLSRIKYPNTPQTSIAGTKTNTRNEYPNNDPSKKIQATDSTILTTPLLTTIFPINYYDIKVLFDLRQ
jgi:hypothetical protein